jgi:hypothetical protein
MRHLIIPTITTPVRTRRSPRPRRGTPVRPTSARNEQVSRYRASSRQLAAATARPPPRANQFCRARFEALEPRSVPLSSSQSLSGWTPECTPSPRSTRSPFRAGTLRQADKRAPPAARSPAPAPLLTGGSDRQRKAYAHPATWQSARHRCFRSQPNHHDREFCFRGSRRRAPRRAGRCSRRFRNS